MCKMVYRIRSTVAYYVDRDCDDGENTPLEEVKKLANEDETFAKMISIVNRCLTNIFAGTDPSQPILNHSENKDKKRKSKKKITKNRSTIKT